MASKDDVFSSFFVKRVLLSWLGSMWWNLPTQVRVLDLAWVFVFF